MLHNWPFFADVICCLFVCFQCLISQSCAFLFPGVKRQGQRMLHFDVVLLLVIVQIKKSLPNCENYNATASTNFNEYLGPVYTWRRICQRKFDEYSTKNSSLSRILKYKICEGKPTNKSKNLIKIKFRKKIENEIMNSSLTNIRRIFAGKFFVMNRWALSSSKYILTHWMGILAQGKSC